jgi:peptidoglycan hydrolase-like protein with peptidoglycan-binding domain
LTPDPTSDTVRNENHTGGGDMADVLLELETPMMRGPAVRRLQEAGTALGFDFGKIDGVFGERTEAGVRAAQAALGLAKTGSCDEATWRALEAKLAGRAAPAAPTDPVPSKGSRIVDRRDAHKNAKGWPRRSWSRIEGVTLHQTGVRLSNAPARWDTVHAHVGITGDGKVILINDPTVVAPHGNGLNGFTIGIEICGNFRGIEEKPGTHWKGGGEATTLSAAQKAALEELFGWLEGEFAGHGATWRMVHAHRQASAAREADPGSKVWKEIAMPWMARLGATDGGPKFKIGKGRTIPRQWNPDYPDNYWS